MRYGFRDSRDVFGRCPKTKKPFSIIFYPILFSTMLVLSSCDKLEDLFNKDEEVVLFPTTVIGPKDGTEGVGLTTTVIIGKFDESAGGGAVIASYITVGDDYKSGPGFLDYLVITQDTLNQSSYVKITEYTQYPYPPEPPYDWDIVKKSRAYFIIRDLKPSTKYYWKIIHDAGDFLLDVTPFRTFTTVALTDIASSVEFAEVEGGTFCFGDYICRASNNVEVELSSYSIGKYEITNDQFVAFLNQTGCDPISGNGFYDAFSSWSAIKFNFETGRFEYRYMAQNHPANTISWQGALAFSKYVGGRLPTKAEWEFAAKGGNLTHNYLYSGSNDPDEIAWSSANTGMFKDVGTKKPNELGIYDMTGNAEEWCSDWDAPFHEIYPPGKYLNPTGPATGTQKTLRGGSIYSMPIHNVASYPLYPGPGGGQQFWRATGFRVVRD